MGEVGKIDVPSGIEALVWGVLGLAPSFSKGVREGPSWLYMSPTSRGGGRSVGVGRGGGHGRGLGGWRAGRRGGRRDLVDNGNLAGYCPLAHCYIYYSVTTSSVVDQRLCERWVISTPW